METKYSVELTPMDRDIINSYRQMLAGLSDYLGSGYEIVLHSLEDLNHSVISIYHGEHTGRKEGAPITDLALEMLEKLRKTKGSSYVSYFSQNRQGEPIKSSTIAVHGENNRIIGLLCINFYLNIPLSQFMQENYYVHNEADEIETFADKVEETIEKAVRQVKKAVYEDAQISLHNKNKEIISQLSRRGIFNLKDAVSQVADLLGLSKNTVYLHLRNDQTKS
ncbi:MAG: hypothetical protein HFF70_01180 [Oscillospiraceae bacterium]|jgi:predicted transcriptional regulator YheO|nr:hypothetical protein [Oscillospiraceae bacterium]